ncbi:MAG TPA: lytic transglycosylase domain-containing protein [Terracidiphilus sp.]|nr:lytic transglycosylase domain-containing protein [Terracidiphilus sp.]
MQGKSVIIVAILATLAPFAMAAERITLNWGSEMLCDHHTQLQDHVRLYGCLSTGIGNYIEFPAQDIAKVELVADPPPAPPADQASKSPVLPTSPAPDAKLNPADLHEMLARASLDRNVDVDLLASIVKAESAGNPHALSRAGARGLMQLMPATANDLGVADSYRPDQNVRGGSTYLDQLLVRYHDNLALALAAYNAGPAAVDKYHGIPPYHETRAYVARVIHEFNRRVQAREAEAKTAASQTRGLAN